MGSTFAEKFEQALADKREKDPTYGLRTLARKLAKDDPEQMETIRRRLHKYRPPKGGGAAEVKPTEPTRREIEKAMGLKRDALAPDKELATSLSADQEFLAAVAPLWNLLERKFSEQRQLVKT